METVVLPLNYLRKCGAQRRPEGTSFVPRHLILTGSGCGTSMGNLIPAHAYFCSHFYYSSKKYKRRVRFAVYTDENLKRSVVGECAVSITRILVGLHSSLGEELRMGRPPLTTWSYILSISLRCFNSLHNWVYIPCSLTPGCPPQRSNVQAVFSSRLLMLAYRHIEYSFWFS